MSAIFLHISKIIYTFASELKIQLVYSMKTTYKYCLFSLVILLFVSCGAKKNVAVINPEQATVERTTSSVEPTDSLPEFLREFANDSTIHINWKYGIPFIIDDSVPMFLPPIDKNPENYIIKHIYAPKYSNSLSQETVYAIIDSIHWVNKCINETQDFVKSQLKETLDRHRFAYHHHLLENDNSKIIEIWVLIDPLWGCCSMPDAYDLRYSYFFDLSGNLLGKMSIRMPFRIGYKGDPQYHLRGAIPNYVEYRSFLKTSLSLNKNDLYRMVVYTDIPECWWGY